MAFTFRGSTSTPTDNGSSATDPTVSTPVGSMAAGDLCILYAQRRASTGTLAMSETGGQTWYTGTQRDQTLCRTQIFWCIFNGTWSASPSVSFGATLCNTVRMMVWYSSTAATIALDVAETGGVYAAPTTPFTVTIPAITTLTNAALVVAFWACVDDNTWGTLSGSTQTWTALSPAMVRNTAGSDQSMSNAYLVLASAGTTGTVSQNQSVVAGDDGTYSMMAFKEVTNQNIDETATAARSDAITVGSQTSEQDATTTARTDAITAADQTSEQESVTQGRVDAVNALETLTVEETLYGA